MYIGSILTACFGTKSNFMFAQRFKACSLLNNDCNESRSRNGWSFCTPFTSMGNCKSTGKKIKRREKIQKIGFPQRPMYLNNSDNNLFTFIHLRVLWKSGGS